MYFLTVDLHQSVNTRHKILNKQNRLYEKFMTSHRKLTSKADRQTSEGSVSELNKCMCAGVCHRSPGKVKPH